MPRTPDDLVRMEVHYCVSFLVSTLASAANSGSGINLGDLGAVMDQAFDLAMPIDDWEEAALQAGWSWDESADEYRQNGTGEGYDDIHAGRKGNWYGLCHAKEIEPYQREVFEHWIVSDWLADKLEAKGEKVDRDFAGMIVWARTCSGQGIASDSVIEAIAADLAREA